MKNGYLLLLILGCCLGVAGGQTTPKKAAPAPRHPAAAKLAEPSAEAVSDEQALVDLERHILDYIRSKNAKDLEPWVAEDFQYSDVAGKTLDREQFLKLVKSVQGDIEWLSAEDMRVRVFGPVAVLTGVQQSRVSNTPSEEIAKPGAAPPMTARTAFSSVFRRRGSSWELVMVYAADLGVQAPPAEPVSPPPPPKATPPAKPPRGEDAPPVLSKPPGAR